MGWQDLWGLGLEPEGEGLRAAWERALEELGGALAPAARAGVFAALWAGLREGSFEIALWEKAVSQAGGGVTSPRKRWPPSGRSSALSCSNGGRP